MAGRRPVIDRGRFDILGVKVAAVDYDAAVEKVVAAAREGLPYTVTALAVHGVMTGALDPVHRERLNHLDLVCPDGMPVRWALDALYATALPDRVYGPLLIIRICERAALEGLPVYLYGSRPDVLDRLVAHLSAQIPGLCIAGSRPSLFRELTDAERRDLGESIRSSGARIVFVGLGCPRQEKFVYEMRGHLPMPAIAVGAAFDFHAGTLPQAPRGMQRAGLEWLFRLGQEPRRLWRRYLYLNPLFLGMLVRQALRMRASRQGVGDPGA